MTPIALALKLAPVEAEMAQRLAPPSTTFIPCGDALLQIDPQSDAPYPSQNRNRVTGLGVCDAPPDGVLEAIAARYTDAGVGRYFHYLSPSERAPSLARALDAAGWGIRNALDVLWRPLSGAVQPVESAQTIRRILSDDTVLCADDWLADRLAIARRAGDAGMIFGALEADVLVAVALLWLQDEVAYLGMAGTSAAFRGRGAQGALIAARLQYAAAHGATIAVSETLKEILASSYRNLERAGFARLYARPIYTRKK